MKLKKPILKTAKDKVLRGIVVGETALYSLSNAMVANATTVTINPDINNVSMDTIMGKVIGLLLDIMRWVGIGFLVWGIYQLYLSYSDNNPDGKIKGITFCVIAIGLITVKSILVGFGLISQ